MPVAPGTFGTLGGVAIAWAFASSASYLYWVLGACVLLYVVGRSLGDWAEKHARGKDPQFFVIDEVIGYLITVLWTTGPSLVTLIVGFCVFRFFDITKPSLVRKAESLPGGDGILMDDVVAGLYGLVVMALARSLLGDDSLWAYSL